MCWLSQYTPLSNGAYYVKHLYSVERYTLLCKATPSKFTDVEDAVKINAVNANDEESVTNNDNNPMIMQMMTMIGGILENLILDGIT